MPAQLLAGFVIIDVDRRKCVGIGVKGGFKDRLEEFSELRPFVNDSQWRISGNLIVWDAALAANLFCVSYMVSGEIGIRCKEINVVNLITEKSFGPDRLGFFLKLHHDILPEKPLENQGSRSPEVF